MKLSKTITDNRIATHAKLNYLCGNHVCDQLVDKPIQELFIESVIQADLISEAHADAIAALLKAQIAKAKAAMAPQTPDDLANLLTFIAPKGGGLDSVEQLIQAAKTTPNLMNDAAWWDNLFSTFGITDEATKQQVLQKFGNLTPRIQAPTDDDIVDAEVVDEPATATEPAADQTEAPQIQTGPRQKQSAKLNMPKLFKQLVFGKSPAAKVNPQTASTQDAKNEIDRLGRLEKTVAQRAQFNAELDKLQGKIQADIKARQEALHARLQELQNKHAQQDAATQPKDDPRQGRLFDSILHDFANILLEFPEVRHNLPTIVRSMMPNRNITLNEEGIATRARKAIGEGWRDQLGAAKQLISNPQQAKSKFRNAQATHDNERIAKQAVKTLTDLARDRFANLLQAQNLTPEQIAQDLAKFDKYQEYLRQKAKKGYRVEQALNPQHLANYQDIRKRLMTAYKVLGTKAGRRLTTPVPPKGVEPPKQPSAITTKLINFLAKNKMSRERLAELRQNSADMTPRDIFAWMAERYSPEAIRKIQAAFIKQIKSPETNS